MKQSFLLLIVISFCSFNGVMEYKTSYDNSDTSFSLDRQQKKQYKILFVGNSLTSFNDLPTLVKREAKKKEVNVVAESLTKKNYAIIDHWNEGKVQKLINSKKFDFVIIQQGPSSQIDGYNMLINDGKKYADLCNLNGAKLAYFMVWPSKTYYYTFDKVIENYTKGATTNNAIICPVGKVWKEYFDQTRDFSYYGKDQFHPSLLGSQVAAKVIVKSLFKK